MEKQIINAKGSGCCRFISGLVTMLAVSLVYLLSPAFGQTSAGDYNPVIERGISAGMDADRLESLVARAQERRVSPERLEGMMEPALSLAERDLPYNPLLQKMTEGMAKSVAPGTIRQVLEQMEQGITRSVAIVDPWMAREEVRIVMERGGEPRQRERGASAREFRNVFLETTSHALQQNVAEGTIREFLDQVVPGRAAERGAVPSIAAGLRALPEMLATQDNPEMSIRLLIRALNAGFTAGEMQQLPDAFRYAGLHSQLPFENIAGGLDWQMGQNMPADIILENLFQGNVGGGPPGFSVPGIDGNGDDNADRGRGRRPPTPSVP